MICQTPPTYENMRRRLVVKNYDVLLKTLFNISQIFCKHFANIYTLRYNHSKFEIEGAVWRYWEISFKLIFLKQFSDDSQTTEW